MRSAPPPRFDPHGLAARFLADTKGDPRPWPEAFAPWAEAHHLTDGQVYDVRLAILGARVFGVVKKGRRTL